MVLTIITLPNTFAAMVTFCQNQQEQLVVGPLIIIHLNTYAADIMFTQNLLALTAVHFGVYTVVQAIMEFQSVQVLRSAAVEKFIQNL